VLSAIILSVLSYATPSIGSSGVSLEPRKSEVWESSATLMLTDPQVPGKETGHPVPDLRFSSLSPVYARLASGDAVNALIRARGGRPPGRFFAYAVVDETTLPLITTVGQASTPAAAVKTVTRGSRAFIDFVNQQQKSVRKDERLALAPLSAASVPTLVDARKKTLPVFVFLAVMCAFVALAFILENARSGRTARLEVTEPVQTPDNVHLAPEPVAQAERVVDGSTRQRSRLSHRADTLHSANPPAPSAAAAAADEEDVELRRARGWTKRSAG
jgi:hypothetical protein